MMRSMYSAVTGLRNHLLRMDVIGNNIANVNTVAYKSSRVTFKEAFYQTLRGGSAPSEDSERSTGGTNPQQVGLGSLIGSVEVLQGQGAIESTGKMTDLAIDGAGFFVFRTPDGGFAYGRGGNLSLDSGGYLVSQDGLYLLGWKAVDGRIDSGNEAALGPLRIPLQESIGAEATANMKWGGNLDATLPQGEVLTRSVQVFDSQGGSHLLVFEFKKTGDNTWTSTLVRVDDQPIGDASNPGPTVTVEFNTDGSFRAASGVQPLVVDGSILGGVENLSITVDYSGVTQYKSEATVNVAERDGHPPGILETFTVDDKGVITGVYSNGLVRPLAQVALATFTNPAGLSKSGGGLYRETPNSGARVVSAPGTGGAGSIMPSSLEMSDVDLAREFTSMLVTQRGFQANSRVITASDEMLREIVGLGR